MNLHDQQLVAEAFEGTLDERGFRKLQDRLREEPELLALYRDHALLHHSLVEEFEGRQMIADDSPPAARSTRGWPVMLVAAALLAAGFAGWKWWGTSGSPEAARDRETASPPDVIAAGRPPLEREGRVLLEDRFDGGPPLAGRPPVRGESHWRLERGDPKLVGGRLDGSDYEAYFTLPGDGLSAEFPVLLVTVTTVEASGAPFHTAGWAGVSLYQDGYEICFFGDSFGPGDSWSLDVKRRLVPVPSSPPLRGPQTMTLRYDRRDGTVELHEGTSAEGEAVARSRLLPGLKFDQVRIGASEEASLALTRLFVRTAGEEAR